MKEEKKFTCLDHNGEKVAGAIEGSKKEIRAWMKDAFPGIRAARPQDMVPAWEFFYEGEIKAFTAPSEEEFVYLAEIVKEA